MAHHQDIEIKFLADCQQHIPALAMLWFEHISKQWVPGASIEKAESNLKHHANRDKLPLTLVALYQDKPVGMASLRENDGVRPDLTPWLGSLVVDPLYRQRKIGEHLIQAIQQQARIFNYDTLYLLAFDPTISRWYANLGWQLIGVDELFGHIIKIMEIKL